MLERTFCHIPGVSAVRERALWDAGVRTWEDFCREQPEGFSSGRYERCRAHIRNSREQVKKRNIGFFYQALPSREHWRLFSEFRRETAYLDIETTGLAPGYDEITTIAVYDGIDVRAFVNGSSLQEFKTAICGFKQIVTYNGKCFDIPFICKRLCTEMEHAHIDLRYVLKRQGYGGGLKACERRLGVKRHGLEDIDGYMAVLLWWDYKRGNKKALETLLAYNMADAVNLETLMVLAYNKNVLEVPGGTKMQLPLPETPRIPYEADRRTIKKICSSSF